MTYFRIISIMVIILSSIFLGCIGQQPTGTPFPTATPTATPTAVPTVVPTTPQPIPTSTIVKTQSLYVSYVDELYGFYSVVTENGSSNYANRTLIINDGDTVKWVSDTTENYYLTIVSKEGLWNNSSSLLRINYSYFSYTFSQPGNYTVYLKDWPEIAPQKIVVNP